MNDIFNQLVNAKLTRQETVVLAQKISAMTPFELDREVAGLNDQQKLQGSIAVADRARGHSTLSKLEMGALLKVFDLLTPTTSRAEAFANMEQETGIKRTQLYDLIAVFDCLGRKLMKERNVASRCTWGALSVLSKKSVWPATHEWAFEYVRGGKHLTIKVAKQLIRKQNERKSAKKAALPAANDASDGVDRNTTPISKEIANSDAIWKFSDPNLTVVVQHVPGGAPIGSEEIIIGLEAALAKARQEYVVTQQELQPS